MTLEILKTLIAEYQPTWHNKVGKTDYQCNWCGVIIIEKEDFKTPAEHTEDCEYIAALEFLNKTAYQEAFVELRKAAPSLAAVKDVEGFCRKLRRGPD